MLTVLRVLAGFVAWSCVAGVWLPSAVAQQVVATIPLPVPAGGSLAVGGTPLVDEGSDAIYIAVSDFGIVGGDVIRIDAATRAVTAATSVPFGLGANLAYDAGTDRLFVPTFQGGIRVLDGTTLGSITSYSSVNESSFLAFDAASNVLYASQRRFPFVDVVDASNGALLTRIPVSANLPGELALDTAHDRLYMTGRQAGIYFLTVIDTVTRTVIAEERSAQWTTMAIDPVNDRLYLANLSTPTLAALDLATGTLVASGIPLAPTSPPSSAVGGIAYNPGTDRIHVSRVNSGTLDTLAADSYAVASTVAIGSSSDYGLFQLAMNTQSGDLFVNHRDTNQGAAIPGRLHVVRDFRLVGIDIKPGEYPNSIHLGSQGNVPVAILGSSTFDASQVDPLTVTLASAPVKLKGKGRAMAAFSDVNGDGLPDLVVHVDTTALQLNSNDQEAVLEGRLFSGEVIRGVDSVRVVP